MRLFLKEVLEGLARVQGTGGSQRSLRDIVGLRIARGSRIFFYGGAEAVEGAIVFYVFGSDTFGYWLRALKSRASVKEAALFAAVELELAFGAGTLGIESGGKDSTAVGAAGASDRANHARGARAELIRPAGASGRRLLRPLFFFFAFRVAIAAVIVLTIHTSLRPSA
jgi:hypothetical protein